MTTDPSPVPPATAESQPRRDVLGSAASAVIGLAAGAAAASSPASAQQVRGAAPAPATASPAPAPPSANPYSAPPGTGISMAPYYRPTPSVRNTNTYFPRTEELGDAEMRITFMGSNPFPPRVSQAATCIMVECGKVGRFFFDFGPGCLKNIIANQVPVAEVNDIFITHLHIDHYGELPFLWGFAPFSMRFTPLRVIGPSGRTPALGTKAMTDGLRQMGAWHYQAFTSLPVGEGYEIEVTEFDYRDSGGICYQKDGVTVRHWQRSHTMDGASAYRLDWNGLSFVWTGDGKPDELSARYGRGADVFVSEMVVDIPALWSLKQGAPEVIGAFTTDTAHSAGYGVGYLLNQVAPRLGMATHFSFDKELIGEAIAEVRTNYRGMFALGIDHTVVNVTKDAIWIREAALPDTANTTRPSPEWLLQTMFGGVRPTEPISMPEPAHTVADVQSQAVRDLEIDPRLYYPPDQLRPFVREWPRGVRIPPAALLGPPPEAR